MVSGCKYSNSNSTNGMTFLRFCRSQSMNQLQARRRVRLQSMLITMVELEYNTLLWTLKTSSVQLVLLLKLLYTILWDQIIQIYKSGKSATLGAVVLEYSTKSWKYHIVTIMRTWHKIVIIAVTPSLRCAELHRVEPSFYSFTFYWYCSVCNILVFSLSLSISSPHKSILHQRQEK